MRIAFTECGGWDRREANGAFLDSKGLDEGAPNEGFPVGVRRGERGAEERGAKDGLSRPANCAGRGDRGAKDGFPDCDNPEECRVCGDLSESAGLDERDAGVNFGERGGFVALGSAGRSEISGLGGLATFTPDAAVFSFATSSRVRLRQSPGGTSSASGPYCTRRIFSTWCPTSSNIFRTCRLRPSMIVTSSQGLSPSRMSRIFAGAVRTRRPPFSAIETPRRSLSSLASAGWPATFTT